MALARMALGGALCLMAAGCAAPLRIEQLDQQGAYERLNRSALTGDRPSETTLTVLRRHDLYTGYKSSLGRTIAALNSQVVGHPNAWGDLFALAELSYMKGRKDNSPPDYMAAAVYAYAFLLPGDDGEHPNPYDPRFRQACDLYNLALAAALTPPARHEASIAGGRYTLPFGTINIVPNVQSLNWHGRQLGGFVPTETLEVEGLQNQYRTPGLGAAMAARPSQSPSPQQSFQVAPRLRVPASLILQIPSPRRQLATGTVWASLSAYNIYDSTSVVLDGSAVPIEYDQTAARAVSLVETKIWNDEYKGFLHGNLYDADRARLVALEPHKPGRMPVVLVHGTASSPFRWFDMVNDLLEDPRIRDHFEFWVFSYETGNPIPYSAMLLREAVWEALASLGGAGADPALGHVVLIGHSQGGLLAKMLVIDPGDGLWNQFSRKPLDQLTLDQTSRDLIRRSLFPQRVKEVDRVVFIATPQRGSYVAAFSIAHLAARLVTLPLSVSRAGAAIFKGNQDALTFDPSATGLGSIYGMTPNNPFIKALAAMPIAPGVHVHSIIPVRGNGPAAVGDDGVVKYQSAHLDNVESERVIRSGHSVQANPLACSS
jgi:pimeloyl-ACP methyl ester carboxylesterase